MKAFKWFASLLGMGLFCACSENDLLDVNSGEVEKEGRYMAVEIISPSAAEARSVTEPEDAEFEEGFSTPDENKVNTLRFYFFDAIGNPVGIAVGGHNYIDATPVPDEEDKDMPNVEQKLKAIIVIRPEDQNKVASMLAVANFDKAKLEDVKSYSRTDLAKISGDYSSVLKNDGTANFMMTSSTYADANGQVTRAYIKPENLCTTEKDALKNPVKIYIERVVAKVKLSTNWNTTGKSAIGEQSAIPAMETVENVSYNGKTYTAVIAKDKDGNVIKNNGKNVYIIFIKWDVTGTADRSYLIKKVNSTSAWTTLNGSWFWNHPAYHRSYWAVNPDDVKYLYNRNPATFSNDIGKFTYCPENAANNFDDGSKSSYNSSIETSNRTQVAIHAVLVTLDNSNNATNISLAKWAGAEYTEEQVKTAMFALVERGIYVKEVTGEGASQVVIYRTITRNEVELVSAIEAGKANNESEESERYLSYLKLTTAAASKGNVYYKDSEGKAQYEDIDAVNRYLCGMPGAKIWHNGSTYYYTPIKHLGQGLNNAGYGYYGVVRNHIYDIKIESVTGLGTPVLNPDENIIPQKPKEDDDTYIAAQIHILSWRKVNNNVDLKWPN